MAVAPNLTYRISHIKPSLEGDIEEIVPLSGSVKKSFAAGYNQIYIIFNSDISLSKYEVRITKADEEYGVGVGTLAYYLYGSIAANTNHLATITLSNTVCIRGDVTYRVSMYALNAADLTWDATSFLLTSDGEYIVDSEGNTLEVYVGGTDDYSLD